MLFPILFLIYLSYCFPIYYRIRNCKRLKDSRNSAMFRRHVFRGTAIFLYPCQHQCRTDSTRGRESAAVRKSSGATFRTRPRIPLRRKCGTCGSAGRQLDMRISSAKFRRHVSRSARPDSLPVQTRKADPSAGSALSTTLNL